MRNGTVMDARPTTGAATADGPRPGRPEGAVPRAGGAVARNGGAAVSPRTCRGECGTHGPSPADGLADGQWPGHGHGGRVPADLPDAEPTGLPTEELLRISERVDALIALLGDVATTAAARASGIVVPGDVVPGDATPGGRSAITAQPSVLLRDGVVDEKAIHEQRITHSEVRQAVRSSGVGGLDQVAAVVLESDGTLSVIPRSQLGDGSALDTEQ